MELPPIVGSAGSTNIAVAIIASAGGGKSSAKRLSVELYPIRNAKVLDDIPLGSGEGLAEIYFEWVHEVDDDGKKVKVKRQTKTGAFVYLDEGQALSAMASRQGSTNLPTIRSAWTGDTLGQANASDERKRILPAGHYSLGIVVGFQPEYAVQLIADVAGGTPQRFLFLSAEDPTIPDEAPPWPGALEPWVPPTLGMNGTPFPQPVSVPDDIRRTIRDDAVRRSRGELVIDPLDAHRNLGRLKVAVGLAVLDHRDAINHEDWHLAGIVMDTSDRVRASISDRARAAAAAHERAEDARAARKQQRLDRSREDTTKDRVVRVIATHVAKKNCAGGHTRRCITQSIAGRDRKEISIDDAITAAIEAGWIRRKGDTFEPGEEKAA